MPGSDPIPPLAIFTAIHNGANYSAGLLDGQHVEVKDDAWQLTTDTACTLHAAAYEAMYLGTIEGALIKVGDVRHRLEAVGGVARLGAP